MIIEIEYYKGDTLLFGKVENIVELKNQFDNIETIYDRVTDNFIELFCRDYQWSILKNYENPDYTYDRDTGILRKNKYNRNSKNIV